MQRLGPHDEALLALFRHGNIHVGVLQDAVVDMRRHEISRRRPCRGWRQLVFATLGKADWAGRVVNKYPFGAIIHVKVFAVILKKATTGSSHVLSFVELGRKGMAVGVARENGGRLCGRSTRRRASGCET